MKTLHLSLQEFDNFRKLAKKFAILFLCTVVHGEIVIEADSTALESLGYQSNEDNSSTSP